MTISIITLWLFVIVFYTIIGSWKLFEKAGRHLSEIAGGDCAAGERIAPAQQPYRSPD